MEENNIYIYYFNDEQKPVIVQINHAFTFDPNNPTKQPNIEYITLQACEGRLFVIEAPLDSAPYVKKWTNKVLLTYQDLRDLLEQEFRHNVGDD